MELVAEKELSAYSRFTRGKYETASPYSVSFAGPSVRPQASMTTRTPCGTRPYMAPTKACVPSMGSVSG